MNTSFWGVFFIGIVGGENARKRASLKKIRQTEVCRSALI